MATSILQVGWSSGVRIDAPGLDVQVLATAGSVGIQRTPVFIKMVDIGDVDENDSRIQIITADGVAIHQGSIAFDCDNQTLPSIFDWILKDRKEEFNISFGTQNLDYVEIKDCVWTNFSLSGSVQGLVTGSLQFMSRASEIDRVENSLVFNNINDRELVPYWQTGNEDVISWSFNVTQEVTPKYLNTTNEFPAYFRIGPWNFTVDVETVVDLLEADNNDVRIAVNKLFSPVKGFRLSETTNKPGLNELAKHSYQFQLHGEPKNHFDEAAEDGQGVIFTVS